MGVSFVNDEFGLRYFASFTRCAYSQIKIRKIGEKKYSVFTAGSIFRSICSGHGCDKTNSVFGSLHHLRMRLQPDKNQKNRREKVFRFYCWQHISVISGHGCRK